MDEHQRPTSRAASTGAGRAVSRQLEVSVPLPGGVRRIAAALGSDPAGWLPPPARPRGLDRWTVELVAGPMTRAVACRVGGVWRVGPAAWRSIAWQPEPEPDEVLAFQRALPVFSGEIGVIRAQPGDGGEVGDGGAGGVDQAVLTLHGSYTAPGGRVGAAADAAGLHRAARATAVRFVADVADRLQRLPTGEARSDRSDRSGRGG